MMKKLILQLALICALELLRFILIIVRIHYTKQRKNTTTHKSQKLLVVFFSFEKSN